MTGLSLRRGRAALAACTALSIVLAGPAAAEPKGGKAGRGGHSMCHHNQMHPGMSRLSVGGLGQARIAPDMATVQLGVTSRADSAAGAMRTNSQEQAAVIEALKAAGVAASAVQTSGLSLNPVMDYGENRTPTLIGYEVSNMVSVRVSDIARLGEVLDAIVSAGANQISGIDFSREDGADAEDQARREAVKDARHKAQILADAAGLRLGPVLMLRDSVAQSGPPQPMMRMAAAREAADVPVQAGEVAVSAQVEMEFALLGKGDCGPMQHGRKAGGPGGKSPDGRPGRDPDSPAARRDSRMAPSGNKSMPPPTGGDSAASPAPMAPLSPEAGPVPEKGSAADGSQAPAAGDMPPPMGTDTGAPEPGEPVVPSGETPVPDAETPSN